MFQQDLPHFLHAHVGGGGEHVELVGARVLRGVVVFVFRELDPHAAVDAIADARHVRD